jgi:hypothetical protein
MLSHLLTAAVYLGEPGQIGMCNPVDGEPYEWSDETRQEVRDRVRQGCKRLGASPILCAYYDAVVVRESSGSPGARHVSSPRDNGLGPMGLHLRATRQHWPWDDADPMYCRPEVSLLVAHSIVWTAVTRYNARSILGVQAIYGGRWECSSESGRNVCRPKISGKTRSAICGRLRDRGYDCDAALLRSALGRRVPVEERRAEADRLSRAYDEQLRSG